MSVPRFITYNISKDETYYQSVIQEHIDALNSKLIKLNCWEHYSIGQLNTKHTIIFTHIIRYFIIYSSLINHELMNEINRCQKLHFIHEYKQKALIIIITNHYTFFPKMRKRKDINYFDYSKIACFKIYQT